MKQALWKPSDERIKNANMTAFIDFVNKRCHMRLRDYFDLYDWSVTHIADFWAEVWDFVGVKASKPYEKVVEDLSVFPGAAWFTGAELNFAENLLRYRDNHIAFVFKGETRDPVRLTYEDLSHTVGSLAAGLRERGVKRGDRVAGYMPNMIETATAMLATTSIGATWASCGSELGVQAVIDRFGQIEPKILFAVDGYLHKNRAFPMLHDVKQVAEAVPSIEQVVIVPYVDASPDISHMPHTVHIADLMTAKSDPLFEQVPFDHPLYIMFSSGTTGKPKCLVQGVGGILINHLKELILHSDLKRDDTITYMTAPSWMMWNWLISSLAVGSTIVLYDGNPGYPDLGTMWKLIDDEQITIFGTSATYINLLKSQGFRPKDRYSVSTLKEICQTGSPLSADGFTYVYEAIKEDVHFHSISGGTDINGCFAAGSPTLPVYAGELQAPALGMKIKAYDEKGGPILDRQGELVCEAPAPSMPLYFLNDPTSTRYRDAYFSTYRNIWRHGDYVEIYSQTRGITFFGRSDAILKPSGVRIGTAEIYNIVDQFVEVADSLAIGQNWENDQRILLFVKLVPGAALSDDLKQRIKNTLRDKASPRHVPAIILDVPDIPYTFNMKKVESAVTNIVNGRPATNRDALSNPASLDYFEEILPIVQARA
jgi:acetoacetyl-CoA synthetase